MTGIRAALEAMGLVAPGEPAAFTPLTGGVSSDIQLVETPRRRFCVKRALPRLKVAAVWEAPVSRNASEAAWLRTVAGWQPELVPELLGEAPEAGLFAMAYLDPATHPVWKADLLAGKADAAFAARVGAQLAAIHAAGAGDAALAAAFANDDLFEALRLEPYLRATGRAHPDLAATLEALADRTGATRLTLIHGDLSPKNTLVGPDGPVLLDAECATYGDPAFDLAFCLNHLLLKGAHAPARRAVCLAAYDALASAYLAGVRWEPPPALEARAAALLPALFLARVDGKSPVEYLGKAARDEVRRAARAMLLAPPGSLAAIREHWSTSHA
jgi:aminoglycoside phosphotransferase (APT) family kinase protein